MNYILQIRKACALPFRFDHKCFWKYLPQKPDLCSRLSNLSFFQFTLFTSRLGSSTNHSLHNGSFANIKSLAQLSSRIVLQNWPALLMGATTAWQRHISLNGRDHLSTPPRSGSGLFCKMHTFAVATLKQTEMLSFLKKECIYFKS